MRKRIYIQKKRLNIDSVEVDLVELALLELSFDSSVTKNFAERAFGSSKLGGALLCNVLFFINLAECGDVASEGIER